MGKVMAVCISEKKGTQKTDIIEATFVVDHGIDQDAHAGNWHRQVSLISADKIKAFTDKGQISLDHGAFGENLIVEGIDFKTLPIGTQLVCNDVILEMTQIGKECHHHCQIYARVGDCIMPREGVFAKVIVGGTIKVGDDMRVKTL